jgi:hypothetical protein
VAGLGAGVQLKRAQRYGHQLQASTPVVSSVGAPVQRLKYARFQGFGALFNWSHNAQETRLEQHEQRLDEITQAMRDHEDHEIYGHRIQQINQRFGEIKAGTHEADSYDGLERELGDMHTELRDISTGITRHEQDKADDDSARIHSRQQEIYKQLRKKSTKGEVRSGLQDELDELQRSHEDVIDRVHRHNLNLWLPKGTSKRDRKRARADWELIRHGSGNLRVEEGAPEEFHKQMRAVHARLLYGSKGRALLHDVLHPKHDDPVRDPLVIRRKAPDTSTKDDRVKRARLLRDFDRHHGAQKFKDVQLDFEHDWREAVERHGGERNIPEEEMNTFQRRHENLHERGQQLREEIEKVGGDAVFEAPGPALAASSGREISVRQGVRDSELYNEGFGGRHVLAPAHIIYGHELIHALRRRKGVNAPAQEYVSRGMRKWGNPEEKTTIAGGKHAHKSVPYTENMLRKEHGLSPRQFHTAKSREEVELAEGLHDEDEEL